MNKWVSVLAILVSLGIGIALGDAWRLWRAPGTVAEGAHEVDRKRLTAISAKGLGRSNGGILDLNALAAEVAGRSVNELLESSGSVPGQFELHTYLSSLDAEELRELLNRMRTEGNAAHPQFNTLLGTVYSSWASLEPRLAFADAKKIELSERSRSAVNSVLKQVGKDDFQLAAELFEQLEHWRTRGDALTVLCDVGAEHDPEQAWEILTDMKRIYLPARLLEKWARHDPGGATATALTLPPGNPRDRALFGITESLAQTDPGEAIAWIHRFDADSDDYWRQASNMVVAMAHSTPEIAVEWIGTQSDPEVRRITISNLVTHWSKSDSGAAIGYAETLAGEEYVQAISSIVAGLSGQNPALAASLLGSDIDPENYRIGQIADTWVNQDPAGAAGWVGSLPAGAAKEKAESGLVACWFHRDPIAASAWVAGRPVDGAGRDAPVGALALALLRSDPEAALIWSAEIQDAERGSELLSNAASRWTENDREAAEAALAGDVLPEAARLALAEAISAADAR